VRSLDFEDHPFAVQRFDKPCALCAATGVYLDEVVLDDAGGRMFVCSDSDYCEERRAQGHVGEMLGTSLVGEDTPSFPLSREAGEAVPPSSSLDGSGS
jgi:alpha-D-ribose 1-methylphosphonate 5-phosphate C-P lyase